MNRKSIPVQIFDMQTKNKKLSLSLCLPKHNIVCAQSIQRLLIKAPICFTFYRPPLFAPFIQKLDDFQYLFTYNYDFFINSNRTVL